MKQNFFDRISAELDTLDTQRTMKVFRHLQTPMAGRSKVEGYGDVVILCSNNYLGLDNKPEVVKAGAEALEKYGAGASSVRFICGTFDIHRELEELTARFSGMESSISYTSCWAANNLNASTCTSRLSTSTPSISNITAFIIVARFLL